MCLGPGSRTDPLDGDTHLLCFGDTHLKGERLATLGFGDTHLGCAGTLGTPTHESNPLDSVKLSELDALFSYQPQRLAKSVTTWGNWGWAVSGTASQCASTRWIPKPEQVASSAKQRSAARGI